MLICTMVVGFRARFVHMLRRGSRAMVVLHDPVMRMPIAHRHQLQVLRG